MTSIWLNQAHSRIRSYSASVKGAKATVKIEVEVSDPGSLGFLLEDLGRAQAELRRGRPTPEPADDQDAQPALGQARQPALGQARQLAIPDLRGERK
jgi:hypothetical protein